MDSTCFSSADGAARALRELYRQYGYGHFRMSKFEEYDFYARNKSFLVSDSIITFTDPDGRLMALKPDVTLSIVKNAQVGAGAAQKVYYNEKVYRTEPESREFREITQTGLECVGDLGFYDVAEVVLLAAKSLDLLAKDYILDVSHLGFVSGLLDHAGADGTARGRILTAISEKNAPYMKQLCGEAGFDPAAREALLALTRLYGPLGEQLPALRALSVNAQTDAAADELERLYAVLTAAGMAGRVHLDFSIVNDMKYYNGFLFRGYVSGAPKGVLAGGCYDRLLADMGKRGRAIGFAIYLDQLERLRANAGRLDADVLLTYDETADAADIAETVQTLLKSGKRVRVQKADDGSVKAERTIHLGKEGGGCA